VVDGLPVGSVGGQLMDPLTLAAATALVSAMATSGWQQASNAVVRLWRRVHPDHVPAIESDLSNTHSEAMVARSAGDDAAEEELVTDWQRKLRRLLAADPKLETELRRVLDQEITPLLPATELERVRIIQQNIVASAPGAIAQGAMFGNVINHGDASLPATETKPSTAC
jgi:hypothetical protein